MVNVFFYKESLQCYNYTSLLVFMSSCETTSSFIVFCRTLELLNSLYYSNVPASLHACLLASLTETRLVLRARFSPLPCEDAPPSN